MKYTPRPYQITAEKHLLKNPAAAEFLDMGLGKTVVTLSAIQKLLDACVIRGVLIVAPLRVVQLVWPQEVLKWDHVRRLKISVIKSAPASRKIRRKGKTIETKIKPESLMALRDGFDIYLAHYDILPYLAIWMARQKQLPFDMIVFDESSKMKTPSSRRFKLMKPVICRFARRVILTGTPATNGYQDLWSQIYLLDSGARLGAFITHFRDRFFDYNPYSYELKIKEGSPKIIEERISDLVLRLDAKDHLSLPELTSNDIMIPLPSKLMSLYKELEDEMFVQIDEAGVEALNAAALSMKCRQFTSGAVYHDKRKWVAVHDEKLNALEDVIDEAQGQPIFACYEFQHELERIKKRWPKAAYFADSKKPDQLIASWNKGNIPLMFAHPASIGHGVNLQYGGHILVFTSGTWSLELHEQTVWRLYRQGQSKPVQVHYLVCPRTIDEAVRLANRTKATTHGKLLDALKSYRKSYQ